jgi:prepilin-type N-terminal cleavage/methylation domain-containing protein
MRYPVDGRRWRSAGFTLIELVMVIIAISMLAAVAVDKLLYYQERAEKAMVDATLESVKMGLRIRMAELISSNHASDLLQLERENPMRWMEEPPAGYAGEYAVPAKPGSWYYSTPQKELVYLPNSTAYLDTGQNKDNKELRFRVVLRYEAEASGTSGAIVGLTLAPTSGYRWF